MDFSLVTGTENIYGDKHVYPENVDAVDSITACKCGATSDLPLLRMGPSLSGNYFFFTFIF